MLELEGKVAIVTGAGRLRGIGIAAAVSLARLGAKVVVTGTGRFIINMAIAIIILSSLLLAPQVL